MTGKPVRVVRVKPAPARVVSVARQGRPGPEGPEGPPGPAGLATLTLTGALLSGAGTPESPLTLVGVATAGALASHASSTSNPHNTTAAQVGLGNVTDDAQIKRSEMGVASGVATLDSSSKVRPSQAAGTVNWTGGDHTTLPADDAIYSLLSGSEAGQIWQRSGGALARRPDLEPDLPYVDSEMLVPSQTKLDLPSPIGDALGTHPSVLDFEVLLGAGGKFAGYRYWMAYTPYPGVAYENFAIAASNDNVTWELPAGAPNPVYGPPASGYYNDTHLIWVPGSSKLRCYWRQYIGADQTAGATGGVEKFYYSESTDGITWSGENLMLDSSVAGQSVGVCPVVLNDGTQYRLYYINANQLRVRYSTDGMTGWSAETNLGGIFQQWNIWHHDIRKDTTGRYHLLVASWPVGKSFTDGDLSIVYASSPNGLTGWVPEEIPQLIAAGDWNSKYLYRPSFLIDTLSPLRVRVWYGAANVDVAWHIGYATGRIRTGQRMDTQRSQGQQRTGAIMVREIAVRLLSAGVGRFNQLFSATLSLVNGNGRPTITMEDRQANKVRAGMKIRMTHAAGVSTSINDTLNLDHAPAGTTYNNLVRYLLNTNEILFPYAKLTALGWKNIRSEISSVDVHARFYDMATSTTLYSKIAQEAALFKVYPLRNDGTSTSRIEFNSGSFTDSWRIFDVGQFTFKAFSAGLQASVTNSLYVDSSDGRLKFKNASSVVVDLQNDVNVRTSTVSADTDFRVYAGTSSTEFTRIQQSTRTLQVLPLNNAGTSASAVALEYNSSAVADAWSMVRIGRLGFLPMASTAVTSVTSALYVDSADNTLRFKNASSVTGAVAVYNASGVLTMPSYTKLAVLTIATLPSASGSGLGAIASVSDGTAGKRPDVVSNGTNWLYSDGTIAK